MPFTKDTLEPIGNGLHLAWLEEAWRLDTAFDGSIKRYAGAVQPATDGWIPAGIPAHLAANAAASIVRHAGGGDAHAMAAAISRCAGLGAPITLVQSVFGPDGRWTGRSKIYAKCDGTLQGFSPNPALPGILAHAFGIGTPASIEGWGFTDDPNNPEEIYLTGTDLPPPPAHIRYAMEAVGTFLTSVGVRRNGETSWYFDGGTKTPNGMAQALAQACGTPASPHALERVINRAEKGWVWGVSVVVQTPHGTFAPVAHMHAPHANGMALRP